MRRTATIATAGLLSPLAVKAHCPLCTVGAAGAAAGAAYLGVEVAAIGIFIGAFAAAIGLWIDRALKKKYILGQKALLVLVSFLTTILPLRGLLSEARGLYLPIGEYGTTIVIDAFLAASILGSLLMIVAPRISDKVTDVRGKKIPYQGMSTAFTVLLIAAIIAQVIL